MRAGRPDADQTTTNPAPTLVPDPIGAQTCGRAPAIQEEYRGLFLCLSWSRFYVPTRLQNGYVFGPVARFSSFERQCRAVSGA